MVYDDWLAHFQSIQGTFNWILRGLIEAETPTSDKEAIDLLGGWMSTWAHDLGASVVTHPQTHIGNIVECRWNTDLLEKPILILCHMDTVHPIGSVEARPTYTDGDRLYGVGAYDMKAGITVVQVVLEELHKLGKFPNRPIIWLLNSDEEKGSMYSRELIEQIGKRAGLVLVMEPALTEDSVVTERKGVGIFQMVAMGRTAHSGSDPDKGVNAIIEMAHQITKLSRLSDRALGTTVSPTVIQGGTTHNVIPDECNITINVRARYHREAERVTRALFDLGHETFLPDALVYTTGGFIRPPMEHDVVMEATFKRLNDLLPFDLKEASKGGGSDGNFTATLGISTLDGLGPTGGGAHSEEEYVNLSNIPKRAAILAQILLSWEYLGDGGGESL